VSGRPTRKDWLRRLGKHPKKPKAQKKRTSAYALRERHPPKPVRRGCCPICGHEPYSMRIHLIMSHGWR
jgi:hypothetical protein